MKISFKIIIIFIIVVVVVTLHNKERFLHLTLWVLWVFFLPFIFALMAPQDFLTNMYIGDAIKGQLVCSYDISFPFSLPVHFHIF